MINANDTGGVVHIGQLCLPNRDPYESYPKETCSSKENVQKNPLISLKKIGNKMLTLTLTQPTDAFEAKRVKKRTNQRDSIMLLGWAAASGAGNMLVERRLQLNINIP